MISFSFYSFALNDILPGAHSMVLSTLSYKHKLKQNT